MQLSSPTLALALAVAASVFASASAKPLVRQLTSSPTSPIKLTDIAGTWVSKNCERQYPFPAQDGAKKYFKRKFVLSSSDNVGKWSGTFTR